ncbi:GNAT family N-acetyltransferase [Algibacter sp.]|jgi:GNAT superfamily N-acetyltransferase|uniref:GNAT family N-acetyltransferase n=1 Tax=uncultured Algibacter sp. TaxID=298659 RepID=UPI00233A4996|nr:GNAT family N-acetyltransferase [uncultured Algibacter sp.]MDB4401996.1 GNAT family N-acetyltransferase [Algibacter sp.]MDC1197768.1 GNAT family N-acetyltransferase [Algibacter sp.]
MIEVKKDIFFSSDFNDMDLKLIYSFVKNSYWGNTRTFEEQKTASNNTINFGLFHNGSQIAYARVMTDKIFFAYLLDVFVIEGYQGKGYSKLLINNILNFPELKNIDKWMLATKDAQQLYKRFGFAAIKSPEKLMEKLSPRAKIIYE